MKDLFSSHAAQYATYRPTYPDALFEHILSFVSERKLLWDAGTGNGQTASKLAGKFETVIATDISPQQIAHATSVTNIEYRIESSGQTSLPDQSVNLITVSQALHWFPLDAFYKEAKRVAKENAWIAAWTYNLLEIDEKSDQLIEIFYRQTLNGYWEGERSWIDEKYKTIPFPFNCIKDPGFSIEVNWDPAQLAGYLSSWSAVQKFIRQNGYNPVNHLMEEISSYWNSELIKPVHFPLYLKMGKVHT
jgi:hypothetical protein